MSRLLEHRDRFLAHFAERGMIEVAGWNRVELGYFKARGKEPTVTNFYHADHFTFSGRGKEPWVESSPDITLYLALSFVASGHRLAVVHFSGWGRLSISDTARVDMNDVGVISSFNESQRDRAMRIVSDFQSNHGQMALLRRLEPLFDKE